MAVRKSDGLLPGPKLTIVADADYRGRRNALRMQATLTSEDRVLLVDDWAERGSQAQAVQKLVTGTGAQFLGLTIIVDQLSDASRAQLGTVTALVPAEQLGRLTRNC